jgi:nucleotide-binding universal stress UspA family protein
MVALHPRHVLVPTDLSEASAQVVEDWVDRVGSPAQLTVLHVAPQAPPSEADLSIGWELECNENRGEQLLKLLRNKFSDPRYSGVHFEVAFGTPATEIAKYAEAHHADLIVMPSHGRTGLARLMIGSVAERVVRLAHCPVLVMRE